MHLLPLLELLREAFSYRELEQTQQILQQLLRLFQLHCLKRPLLPLYEYLFPVLPYLPLYL